MDDDYYSQPGALFRLINDSQKQQLFNNIAASIESVPQEIQQRQRQHFSKADPAYVAGVAKALDGPQSPMAAVKTAAIFIWPCIRARQPLARFQPGSSITMSLAHCSTVALPGPWLLGQIEHIKDFSMVVCTSIAVFLFCAIALVVPSGFSVGALLLLLGSTVLLGKRGKPDLKKEDYLLIAVFALYFACCALINWFHGARADEYDVPLRFALAIPALVLLRAYPPAPASLWAGIAAGGIAAGLFAGWQVLQMGAPRAYGHTNPIQYGNISLLFGVLCLAGLGWAFSQRRARFWISLLLAGAGMGVLGSIFTGSRGSWISLPVCFFVLYKAYGGRINKRYLAGIFVVLIAIFAAIYSVPRTRMQQRMAEAAKETNAYFESGNTDTSIGARFEMWRTGLMIYPERPWFGWGKWGYMQRKAELVAAGKVAAFTAEHTHVHNEYLDALVKRGLPGLLMVLGLYMVPLMLFAKRLQQASAPDVRPYAVAGVLLIVCYFFFGLTQAFLTHNNGVMILAFMLAILWSLLRSHEHHG